MRNRSIVILIEENNPEYHRFFNSLILDGKNCYWKLIGRENLVAGHKYPNKKVIKSDI